MFMLPTICSHLIRSHLQSNQEKAARFNYYEQVFDEGPVRVKFQTTRVGSMEDFLKVYQIDESSFLKQSRLLGDALTEMEKCGAAPICSDGKIGGNGSVAIVGGNEKRAVLVSRSGRTAGLRADPYDDLCAVVNFDLDTWTCEYYSANSDTRPSSDSPLHFGLVSKGAKACLHGHAIATYKEAKDAGIPCSMAETLFSTKADLDALLELIEEYPQESVFIRRGHGFFIKGDSVKEVVETFCQRIVPHMRHM